LGEGGAFWSVTARRNRQATPFGQSQPRSPQSIKPASQPASKPANCSHPQQQQRSSRSIEERAGGGCVRSHVVVGKRRGRERRGRRRRRGPFPWWWRRRRRWGARGRRPALHLWARARAEVGLGGSVDSIRRSVDWLRSKRWGSSRMAAAALIEMTMCSTPCIYIYLYTTHTRRGGRGGGGGGRIGGGGPGGGGGGGGSGGGPFQCKHSLEGSCSFGNRCRYASGVWV
jgi:hypothetical protein